MGSEEKDNHIYIDINCATENCICARNFNYNDTICPAQHYTYTRLEEEKAPVMCLEETWTAQCTAWVVNLIFSYRLTAPGHLEVVEAVKRLWMPERCSADGSVPGKWVIGFTLPAVFLRNSGESAAHLTGGFGEIMIRPGESAEIPVTIKEAAYIHEIPDYRFGPGPFMIWEQEFGTDEIQVSELLGKTVQRLDIVQNDRALRFYCSNGSGYILYHCQNCCEEVRIEDIAGDLCSLLNSPYTDGRDGSGENGRVRADSLHVHFL